MKTDTHILNRLDAVPNFKWMHVCPLGEHPWTSADGAEVIVQIIDQEACEAMARTYPLSIPNSRVDVDHESMDADKRTAAVGWGRKAEARDDGLWVEVEWNPDGYQLVSNKVYRFNSPCFPRDGLVALGNGRFRVTKLGVIALTNDPNLRGQKPLTNSRAQSANPNTKTTSTMDYKAMMLSLLGLPADASDDAITAAITSAKGQSDAMNSRITELETQLVNRDLDEHGITDVEQRKLLSPMLANTGTRSHALALIGKLKPATTQTPLHNRTGAPVPNTVTQLGQGDADPEKEARIFQGEVLDYKNSKGCSYEAAHQAITNKRRAAGA